MATNLVNYIGNLGKSVAYSTVDKFSKMAPATTEFVKTNNELYKSVYENIRDYKTTYRRTSNFIKGSKVYEAGGVYLSALVDDISTGKLYNRERQSEMEAKAIGFNDGGSGDDDWGSFSMDDSDFGLGDDSDNDFGSFTVGDELISESVKKSSEANANAVSMAIARTGEYIVENNKMQNNLMFSHSIQAFSNINSGINTVNENIGKMLEFSSQVLKTHVDNSTKFYDNATQQLQQQTAYLKQIVDAVVTKAEEKNDKEKITFEDIIGTEGTPDLKKYFSVVKKNASNMLGAVPNMDFGGGGNPLLAFVAQPLKFIPDLIVSKMVPKMIESSIQDFDKSLSNYFGSAMLKVNGMKKSDNPLLQRIGQLFGVSNGLKNDIDTSTYEKGKVSWDGKSKKALEEVIPTHLARIESLLSGKGERRYDYSRGKFVEASMIKKDFDNIKNAYSKNASSDMMDEFKKYMNILTFNSKAEKDKLDQDIQKIFDYMYKNGEMFDVNNKDFDDLSYKYNVDSKNLRIFRALFRQTPNHKKLSINNDIMRNRQKQTTQLAELEKQGSIYGSLYNGLPIDEFVKTKSTGEQKSLGLFGKDSLNDSKDNLGHNIFYYLQNLMGDLNYIRKNGGGMGMPGSSFGPREIIDNKGNKRTVTPSLDIPDDSTKTKLQLLQESKARESRSFVRTENRRREKNSNLFNVSEFEGEDKALENILKSRMEGKDIEDSLKEKDSEKNKESFFDDLIGKSLIDKWNVFMDKGTDFLNKPMKFVSSVLKKADQHLYESIYGSDDGETRGFMDLLINSTKKTFSRMNTWIDDNILEPMKKKLEIENLKDLGKKFFGMFGIDLDETGKQIKTYFFGNKDTGERGLFSDIGDGFKNTFKNAFGYVKGAVTGTFKDLTKPFRGRFKSRKAAFKQAELNDEETTGQVQETVDYSTRNYIDNNIIGTGYESSGMDSNDYANLFDDTLNQAELSSYNRNRTSPQAQKRAILNKIKEIKKKQNEAKLDLQTLPPNTGRNRRKYLQNFIKDCDTKIARLKGQLSTIGGRSNYQLFNANANKISAERQRVNDLKYKFSQEVIPDAPTHETDLYKMEQNFPNLINGKDDDSVTVYQEQSTSYLKDIRDFLLSLRGGKSSKANITSNILPVNNPDRDPNESGVLKSTANDLATVIYNFLQGNTAGHAEGSNVLKKPELATLNEGELVLNERQTSSLSKLMDTLMESLGTAGNKLSDIASDGYKRFNKVKDDLGDKINLTDFDQMSKYVSGDVKAKYGNVIDLNQYKKVMGLMDKQRNLDNNVDEKGVPLDPIQRALYNDVKPFVTQMGEEFKTGVKSIRVSLFGSSPEDDSEKFKNVISDVSENISEYAPKMLPAAVLGSGVSLLTGAIGGPILGAAIGAGTSLAINSEKVQTWLLGDTVADERTGGVIPKGVIDTVQKYLPDAGKYGTFGALAGLFTPLGLVGGLAVGASASFVKNNESVQNMLFGEEGLFDEKQKEKLKKALPRIGLGALVGATVGPFGLVGNAVLGSAVGMATTSNKFNEAIMGKYNENTGEYEGGILPTLREKFVLPITTFGDDMKTKFMYFLENDIIDPLKRAFDPLKRGSRILINTMVRGMGHAIDWVFEKSFGTPLSKLAQTVTSKISGFAKGLGKAALGMAKTAIALPFKALGLAGDAATRSQIASGNAYDLTAEQRLAKMDGRDYKLRALDQMLVNGDISGVIKARDAVQGIADLNKSDKKKRKEMATETGDKISSFFNYSDTKNIMGAFRDGDNDTINKRMNESVANKRAALQKVNENVLNYYNQGMTSINSQAKKRNWNEKDIEYKTIKLKDEIKKKFLKDFDVRTQKEILDRLDDESKFTKFMDTKSATLDNDAEEMRNYLSGQQSKFEQFRANKANKNKVLQNLQSELKKSGIDIDTSDPKQPDQLYQMLDREIKGIKERDKTKDKEESEGILGSTDEVLAERHTQIVNLFSETIKVLKSLNGEEEVTNPIDANDPAKTISNIINSDKSAKDNGLVLDKVDNRGIITHIDDNGNVIQYKQEQNGDLSPNLSDSGTRLALLAHSNEEEERKGLLASIRDKIFGSKDDEEKGESKEGIISKLKGFFSGTGGIIKTAAMAFGGGWLLKQLASSGLLDGIITAFAPKLASLIGTSITAAIPTVGSTIKSLLFPQLGDDNTVGKEEVDKSLASNGIVRDIAKGGKGLSKIAAKTTFKNSDILHPISGALKATTNIGSRVGSFIGKGVQKITNPINNSKILTSLRDKLNNKAVNNIFTQTAKVATEESSEKVASKFGAKFAEKLAGMFDNKAVRALLGDYSDKIITEFVPEFAEKVSKKAAQGSAKATGRLAAAVTTGGLLTAAFAVTDFVSGYNDAVNILKITPEQLDQLGMFPKIASGLTKSLLGAFIITSFVPEEWVVPTIVNLLAPLFGMDNNTLNKMQDQAKQEVSAYNKQNNTNYDIRQYNHDVKGHKTLGEKVGFNVNDIVRGKGVISKLVNPFSSTLRLVGDVSNKLGFEKFGNAINGSLDWVGDKTSSAVNWVGNGIKGLFSKNKGEIDNNNQSNPNMVSIVAPENATGGPRELMNSYSGLGGPDTVLSDTEPLETRTSNTGSNSIKISESSLSKLHQGLKSKIAGSVGGVVTTNPIIATIIDKAKKFTMSIINNQSIQTLLGADNCQSLYEKFIPALVEFLQINLSKNIAKLTTKVTSLISGGILNTSLAVNDFMSGFNDANAILGIVDEPTTGMRVSAGFLRAFTGFICLTFIAENLWVNLFSKNIIPIFSKDDDEIEKMKNEAQKQLDNYNIKNNTDLSAQEFVKMRTNTGSAQSIMSRVTAGTKALYQQVKTGVSHVWNKGKEYVGNAVNSVKNTASSLWNKGKQALGIGGPKDTVNNNPLYSFDYDKDYKGMGGPVPTNPNAKDFYGYGVGGPYTGMGGPNITNNKDFLNYVIPGAQKAYEQYGIYPSIMIAQAINESGWGKSKLAKTDNNLFGIKKPGVHDPSVNVEQGSWATDDGGYYAKYKSWDDSMKDHGYFLRNNSRYAQAGVFDAKSPEEQITAIKKAGYASDPKYVSTTMSIINSNNLSQYDTGEYKGGSSTGDSSSTNSNNESSSTGSILQDLGNLMNKSIYKIFGIDTGNAGDSSSSTTTGASATVTNDKVDTSKLSGAVKTVVDAAASKIGCPYVWGGTGEALTQAKVNSFRGTDHDITRGANWKDWIGKEGYDCSGLMQYAFNKAGIDIGRSTYEQVKAKGTRIDVNQAQAGDLIFFGSETAPHHVGLSIGNGQMIEAPSSGKAVKVSNVSDRKDASCARRVISETGQGGLLAKFSDKKRTFKAKYDVNSAIGGPADTFFSKTLNGNVTSGFGFRNTRGSIGRNHTGIDIGAKKGQDIKAPVSGVVTKKVDSSRSNGYGNLVTVKDSNGAEHYFGHMENPTNLKPGDVVKPGQKLGNVGNTGNSTGSHLHYEVKKSGISVDPNKYLANKGIGGEDANKVKVSTTTNTNTVDNTTLLKTMVGLLSKIAENTVSISDIFNLIKAFAPNNNSSENNTAVAQQDYKNKQTQITNLLKKTTNKQNELGDQELMNILNTLAQI